MQGCGVGRPTQISGSISRSSSGHLTFWLRLRLQHLEAFGSGSRKIWSKKIRKNSVLFVLYNSLAPQIISVEPEPKFPALPYKYFWLRLQPSKIAWAPAPQAWFHDHVATEARVLMNVVNPVCQGHALRSWKWGKAFLYLARRIPKSEHVLQSGGQGRNDWRGKGGTIPRAPNHYGGGATKISFTIQAGAVISLRGYRIIAGDAEKSQQCHKYFLQYSKFASEKAQVRPWRRQTWFLPRTPSNLVAPLPTV